MARNVRQKYSRAPVRAPQRRDSDSSSIDLSDDNGYSGVEDVSDSDDDDEDHVFAAEEEHIITNASRKRALVPPRPLLEDDDDDADEENEVDEADEDDESEAEAEADPVDDGESWEGIPSDPEDLAPVELPAGRGPDHPATPVERHVRFAGVPDSDSDSTTSETSDSINDFFPDIFVEQSALDPSFRREIEDDDETSSNDSFWNFHSAALDTAAHASDDEDAAGDADITPTATPRPSQLPTEMPTPVPVPAEMLDLDGYESEYACPLGVRRVLILVLCQPTVILPKKMYRSPLCARSRCGGLTRRRPRPTRTRNDLLDTGLANPALGASISTGLTISRSASWTRLPGR